MNVVITSLGQHLDFESKVVLNILTMRLPNGDEAQLPISDEIAAQFVTAFTGNPPMEVSSPLEAPVAHEVFGTMETTEGSAFVMNPEEEVHVAPPPRKAPTRKSRLVGKDNAGNPIVAFTGKDVGDITDALGTLGDKDEDGVSQL